MQTKRIICVESCEDTAKAVKILLEREGFITTLVYSGQEALKIANEGFQLFLMDILLPDMTGWDLFIKLKRKFPDEKYIFFGNFDISKRTKEELFDNGVNGYLLKPFEKEEFLKMITQVLC